MLWKADKEVKLLAAMVISLLFLSITLKVVFSPLELIELISMPDPQDSPAPAPIEIKEEIHLPILMESPITEVEPPKIQLTFEHEITGNDIGKTQSDTDPHMKLCLKDNRPKSKDIQNDPVKTIKMTLCDEKGTTLFEESTQFQVCEDDGVLPTLIFTTSPIPIDNY